MNSFGNAGPLYKVNPVAEEVISGVLCKCDRRAEGIGWCLPELGCKVQFARKDWPSMQSAMTQLWQLRNGVFC